MHLKLIRNLSAKSGSASGGKFETCPSGRRVRNSREGFTLIELLITIVLFSVGLIGIVSFFNASLKSGFEAKNELIAAGLAQEGTELVRNLADFKKLGGSDWDDVVNALQACDNRIDYRSLTETHPCGNGASVDICFVNASGQYRQCGNGETGIGMTRTISFSYDATDKYLKITSQVRWNNRTTTAVDRLYENEY